MSIAFDKAWRKRLNYKLKSMVMCGSLVAVLKGRKKLEYLVQQLSMKKDRKDVENNILAY